MLRLSLKKIEALAQLLSWKLVKIEATLFRLVPTLKNWICLDKMAIVCSQSMIYTKVFKIVTKAELLLLKLIHLFAREALLAKKLEIEETKIT